MSYKSLLPAAIIVAPAPALAHVKWFSTTADCMATPLAPLAIASSPFFIGFSLVAILTMLIVISIDDRLSRQLVSAHRYASQAMDRKAAHGPAMLRLGIALYFVSVPLYFDGPSITLTPELKTTAYWVPMLQLGIAIAALSRRSAPLASIGIIFLYAYSVKIYGWFHMLDYLFFLGIAAAMMIDAIHGAQKRTLYITVLRVMTGISFLWVSVEKWSYPDWTAEVLQRDLPMLLMGFSPNLFAIGAGFAEFFLAFVLIFGGIASRVAAGILLLFLVAAMPLVGMVDAIGHLPFTVVLGILAVTGNSVASVDKIKEAAAGIPLGMIFIASVPGLIGAYYIMHELAYDTLGRTHWSINLSAFLFMMPAICCIGIMMRARLKFCARLFARI